MAANRCSICAVNWPVGYGYITCPHCGGKVSTITDADPITVDEAAFIKKRLAFDAYYAKRGAREVDVDFSYLDEIAELESIPVAGEPIPVPSLPPELWGVEAHRLGRM